RAAGPARMTGALVLAGVTLTSFLTPVQTFVQQQHTDVLQNVYSFILGGFTTASWHDAGVAAPYIGVSSLVLVLHRRVLDVLALGDEEAASLGVNVGPLRLILSPPPTAAHAPPL